MGLPSPSVSPAWKKKGRVRLLRVQSSRNQRSSGRRDLCVWPRSSWPTRSKPGLFVSWCAGGGGRGGSRGEGSRGSTGYGRRVEFSSFDAFEHTGFYSDGVERANRSPDHTCSPETRSLRRELIPFYLLRERANDVCTRQDNPRVCSAESHRVSRADVNPKDVIQVQMMQYMADLHS